jgi:hypothetical protein
VTLGAVALAPSARQDISITCVRWRTGDVQLRRQIAFVDLIKTTKDGDSGAVVILWLRGNEHDGQESVDRQRQRGGGSYVAMGDLFGCGFRGRNGPDISAQGVSVGLDKRFEQLDFGPRRKDESGHDEIQQIS